MAKRPAAARRSWPSCWHDLLAPISIAIRARRAVFGRMPLLEPEQWAHFLFSETTDCRRFFSGSDCVRQHLVRLRL